MDNDNTKYSVVRYDYKQYAALDKAYEQFKDDVIFVILDEKNQEQVLTIKVNGEDSDIWLYIPECKELGTPKFVLHKNKVSFDYDCFKDEVIDFDAELFSYMEDNIDFDDDCTGKETIGHLRGRHIAKCINQLIARVSD